jgi:hypothetical protein
MNDYQLHAGAAQIGITPPVGVSLAGSLTDRISTQILDPLHARVIVLEAGSTRVAYVLLDLIAIGNEDAARARDLIGAAAGVLPENICISCTHTHSGPCSLELFYSLRNAEYLDEMLPRVAEAAREAARKLQPARAAWSNGREANSAFNRRYHLSGAHVEMNPGFRNPEILKVAGPTDPQLPVLMIETLDRKPLAALANFSLHYVGDHNGYAISSDYYGQFSKMMQERHGADFIALMTHGFSGDINAIDVRGEETLPPTEKSRRIANRLADEIDRLWQSATFHDEVYIGSTHALQTIGVRKISGAQIEENRAIEADESLDEVTRAYARERLILLGWPDEFPVEVQALRVGDFASVAMPGEMFCRLGMDVKHASPFPVTATLDLANGYSGYMPTQTDYVLGGYETELARSAFAAPGAGEAMVVTAAKLLRELAQQFPIQHRAF